MRGCTSKKIARIGFRICVSLLLLMLLLPFLRHGGQRKLPYRDHHAACTAVRHMAHPASPGRAQRQTEGKAISSTREMGQLGYLVVLCLPEQFYAATEDLAQLYKFNHRHLKLGMIEPYVLGSHLSIVPPISEDFRSLPLISTFFNRSQMLHNLEKCFNSDRVILHSFPDFLVNAAREFIVVAFIRERTMVLKSSITECNYYNIKHIEYILNYHLEKVKKSAISKHGREYTFRGVHSLCVNAIRGNPFSMIEVAASIRTWMTKRSKGHFFPEFSVVVPEWRAVANKMRPFYYYDPSYTRLNMTGSCKLRSLSHTSYITQAAKSMFQDSSLSRPFIAVHVRSERIAEQELDGHRRGFANNCIKNFSRALHVIMREHDVSQKNVVFIHDGSEYGSDFMGSRRRKVSNYIISKIKAIGIMNIQYKPQDINNSIAVNSALAQFVEKDFLVSADVLILLGYGGFQSSLIASFKGKRSGGNNWYKLCSDLPSKDHLPLMQS